MGDRGIMDTSAYWHELAGECLAEAAAGEGRDSDTWLRFARQAKRKAFDLSLDEDVAELTAPAPPPSAPEQRRG